VDLPIWGLTGRLPGLFRHGVRASKSAVRPADPLNQRNGAPTIADRQVQIARPRPVEPRAASLNSTTLGGAGKSNLAGIAVTTIRVPAPPGG